MVRLPNHRSADRLLSFSRHRRLSVNIDHLDKLDAPLIPGAYICLLDMPCLVSLSKGLAGYTFPLCNTLAVQKTPASSTKPVRGLGLLPYDPPQAKPARARLRTVRATLNTGRPALLTTISFILTTNFSDSIFGDIQGASTCPSHVTRS